jgi:D-amino-acid dehydrogenase
MHVAIIGGGIIGTATGHALLDGGHEVTFIDHRGFGEGASKGNAGWIAHMDVLPLASPKAWRNLPRWLADPLGPLSIRPAYLPQLVPWLLRFAAASHPARIRASTEAIAALHALSLPAWERRLQPLALDAHLRRSGILSVWADDRAFRAAAPVLESQASRGIPVETVGPGRLRELEPALSDAAVAGALYESGCHVDDPHGLTAALGQAALARGASLLRMPAESIRPADDHMVVDAAGTTVTADRVVVAAGAWSRPFAERLGDRVPLDTERGYNATFPPGSLGLTRPVMFEGQGFVTTPLETGDRVGGAVEFAGLDAPPNMARVDAILRRLRRFVPDAKLDGGDRWMGFRPSIPDSLPVIGPSRRDSRTVYAFGHGHYGLTQAAATAELVAAIVDARAPPLELAPFSAQRFRRAYARAPAARHSG